MSTLGLSNCFNLSYGEIKSNTSGHTIIGNLAIPSTTILERKTSHFICRRKTRAVNSQRLLKDFTFECLALSLSRFPFRFCSASPFPAFLQFFLMILVYCSAAIKVKAASDTFISISMKQPKGWENHAGVKASSESYT